MIKKLVPLLAAMLLASPASGWSVGEAVEYGEANYDQAFTYAFSADGYSSSPHQDVSECQPNATVQATDLGGANNITVYDCYSSTGSGADCIDLVDLYDTTPASHPFVRGFVRLRVVGSTGSGSVQVTCNNVFNKTFDGSSWVATYPDEGLTSVSFADITSGTSVGKGNYTVGAGTSVVPAVGGVIQATALSENALTSTSQVHSGAKTGGDSTLVTGTAAGSECAEWDGTGDLAGSGEACVVAGDLFTPNSDPVVDHPGMVGGNGIEILTGGIVKTDSSSGRFLRAGGLSCTAGKAGAMQTMIGPLQYCDETVAPGPQKRYAAYADTFGRVEDFTNAAELDALGYVAAEHSGSEHADYLPLIGGELDEPGHLAVDGRFSFTKAPKAITLFEEDVPLDVIVVVTSAGHGLTDGDEIIIRGTTHYNGYHTVSNSTTDTFEIADTWNGDQAPATWTLMRSFPAASGAPDISAGSWFKTDDAEWQIQGFSFGCDDFNDDVGVPQTTGDSDGFCDSDGTTSAESIHPGHVINIVSEAKTTIDCYGGRSLLCGSSDIELGDGDWIQFTSEQKMGGNDEYGVNWRMTGLERQDQYYGDNFVTEGYARFFEDTFIENLRLNGILDLGTTVYLALDATTPSVLDSTGNPHTIYHSFVCVDNHTDHCVDIYDSTQGGPCNGDAQCSGASGDGYCDYDGETLNTSGTNSSGYMEPQRYGSSDGYCDADADTLKIPEPTVDPIVLTEFTFGQDGQIIIVAAVSGQQLITYDCDNSSGVSKFECGSEDILGNAPDGHVTIWQYDGPADTWTLLALESFSDVMKVGLRDAQTITGLKTFDVVADREWSPVTPDVAIGDADEGVLQIGGGYLGFADQTISTTDLSDIMILWSTEDSAEDIAFMLVSPANLPRFVVAEEGSDLATYNPRSMVIGPASTLANVDENILCSTNFSFIDCDTGLTGADLGIEDDLEVGGTGYFTERLFADINDTYYSRFGGAPNSVTPSDSLDQLVIRKLRDSGTASSRALLVVLDIDTTSNLTSGQMGFNSFVYTNESNSINNTRAINYGGAVSGRISFRHQGSGTWARGGGLAADCEIQGGTEAGTITDCYAFLSEGGDGGAGAGGIGTYRGFWKLDSTGNVTNDYGLYVEALSNATNSYGFRVDSVVTQAGWLGAGGLYTTPAQGLAFGSDRAVNLYRGAADQLKTDNSFRAGGDIFMNATEEVAEKDDTVDEKCFVKNNPQTDQEWETIWHAPYDLTIQNIYCEVDAGTVLLDFEIDDGTPTGVNGSDITCPAPNGINDAIFSGDATMAAGDRLDLDLGTVTTAVRLSACFMYEPD